MGVSTSHHWPWAMRSFAQKEGMGIVVLSDPIAVALMAGVHVATMNISILTFVNALMINH
jgi:hypothetical protein